jgi:hypothetical protein
MKKLGLGILLAVSLIMFASSAFCAKAGLAKDWKPGNAIDRPPMMGMMNMTGNLVATTDGGVVVLMGNKLYKFDKKLNLIKETEIKVDGEHMPVMMNCPMQSDETKDKTQKPIAPEDKTGHELHHPQ